MAITLNGTTGISSPGGDTSTSLATTNLSYTGTLTGGTGVIAIGTNQIYKDASGNVGIGTASPLAKLSIGSGTLVDANVPIQMNAAAGSGVAYIGFNNAGGYGLLVGYDNAVGYARIRNISNTSLAFSTNDVERMRLDSSGNLLLGTTTSNGLLLEMTSTTQQTCGITVTRSSPNIYTDIYGCGTGGTWQGNIRFFTSNNAAASERARIDSSGNLLVGTTSTTGSTTNLTQLVGGVYSSLSGSGGSFTSGVAGTIFTMANINNGQTWLVTVTLDGEGVTSYNCTYVVVGEGANASVALLIKGANASISVSGLAVQYTQSSGGTKTNARWSAIRIL